MALRPLLGAQRGSGAALRAGLFAVLCCCWCAVAVSRVASLAADVAGKVSKALPFVVLHGLGDQCSNAGLLSFTSMLAEGAGAEGTCIEVGRGASDTWVMRMDRQTEQACGKILQLPHLSGGFNLIGLSQGALIGRALIQMCDGMPQVHTFISIGGPHAGVASLPQCMFSPVCRLIDSILRIGVYSEIVQDLVAPAGYVKIPNDLPAYLSGCKFLPLVNNEWAPPHQRNQTYADRMKGVHRVVLVKFSQDTVLFPPETAHFGFFAPNDFNTVLTLNQTLLYKEDWVGMRYLVEAGRVDFISLPGNHLYLPRHVIQEKILPYLVHRPNTHAPYIRTRADRHAASASS